MQFKSRGRALRNQALATAAVQIGRQGGGPPVSQVHSPCICIIYGYTDSAAEDTYMKRPQQTTIMPCDSADQPTHKYHFHSHSFLGNSSTRRLASKATLERRTPLAGSDKVPAPAEQRQTAHSTNHQPPHHRLHVSQLSLRIRHLHTGGDTAAAGSAWRMGRGGEDVRTSLA